MVDRISDLTQIQRSFLADMDMEIVSDDEAVGVRLRPDSGIDDFMKLVNLVE